MKTLLIILIVLGVLLICIKLISAAVCHRSLMAAAVELYFRVTGTKKVFEDPEMDAKYIGQRRHAKEYRLDKSTVKSDISETAINGSLIYTLGNTGDPEYRIIYLHGGAYINDPSIYHWKFCDKLARMINCEVTFPIYPLTPAHTWEETFGLVLKIYSGLTKNSGVPVIIMGDSAGGGLAAAFCEYLDKIGISQPDKIILLSPWLDLTMSNPEAAKYEKADPMLSAYGLIEMGKCWAGGLDPRDYRVSPIFGDISCLRNVYLFVGTREIFYPDVTEFYSMLQNEGITSGLYVGKGMNHVYPLYPIPEANKAIGQICEIITE